jgi:hypothetical protein
MCLVIAGADASAPDNPGTEACGAAAAGGADDEAACSGGEATSDDRETGARGNREAF